MTADASGRTFPITGHRQLRVEIIHPCHRPFPIFRRAIEIDFGNEDEDDVIVPDNDALLCFLLPQRDLPELRAQSQSGALGWGIR